MSQVMNMSLRRYHQNKDTSSDDEIDDEDYLNPDQLQVVDYIQSSDDFLFYMMMRIIVVKSGFIILTITNDNYDPQRVCALIDLDKLERASVPMETTTPEMPSQQQDSFQQRESFQQLSSRAKKEEKEELDEIPERSQRQGDEKTKGFYDGVAFAVILAIFAASGFILGLSHG
jgi:hypothetical protein